MPCPPEELLHASPIDPLVRLHLTRCGACRDFLCDPKQGTAPGGWLEGLLKRRADAEACGPAPKKDPPVTRGQVWLLRRSERAHWSQEHYWVLILECPSADEAGHDQVRVLGLICDENNDDQQTAGLIVFEPWFFKEDDHRDADDDELLRDYRGLLAIPEARVWVSRSLFVAYAKSFDESIVVKLESFKDGDGDSADILHVIGGPQVDPGPSSDLPTKIMLARDCFAQAVVMVNEDLEEPTQQH